MPVKDENVLIRAAFASIVTCSQILGVAAVVMTGVWFSKYEGGFAWNDSAKQFNYHPLFMVIGLILLNAEAMITYRVFRNEAKVIVKIIHLCLQTMAFIVAIVGLLAVFKYHNQHNIKNMTSLHSWIGIIIVILFGLQLAIGSIVFLLPGVQQSTKATFLRFHKFCGIMVFVASVFECCIGITEKSIFSIKEKLGEEAMLANFLGLVLILFCVTILLILVPEEFRRLTEKERAIIMLERYDSE